MNKRIIAGLSALVLVTVAAIWWAMGDTSTRVTAYFDKAVGVYPGSSVRVLGVEVGKIDAVRPQGDVVRVDLAVDRSVRVPADAKAVVVAPSLVSDRYVQLTPAYTGGAALSTGAVIGKDRTATPAELDELYRNVNTLAQALGPNGANENGAVSDLLNVSAATLDGNGADLNTTVKRLGDLAAVLQDNKDDMFATVDNLNTFTATLAASDQQINEFYGRLADTSSLLAAESTQLGTSLNSLAGTLGEVEHFVRDNRELMSSNVQNLTGVTQALVDQRQALGEVLDIMPLATSNFINAYDSASGAVATRWEPTELGQAPVLMLCKLAGNVTPQPIPQSLRDTCERLNAVIDGKVPLPSVAETLGGLEQIASNATTPAPSGSPVPLPLVDARRGEHP